MECFDIMATTLELAGIEAKHAHFSRSLIPQLNGEGGDPERAVFCEGGYDDADRICNESFPGYPGFKGYSERPALTEPEHIYSPKANLQKSHPESVCRTTMIRTSRHKLVMRTRDTGELYDLREDPGELRNLIDDPDCDEIRRNLERRMLDWHIRTADTVPFDRDDRRWP